MGSASSLLSEPEPKFEVTNTSVRALPNILFDADSIPFKTLKLTNNNILSIQHEVQQLTSLEVVDLSHNKIARVPFQLLELPRLRCLSLAGNCLQKIYDVNKATKLQYLDISENHFESMLDVHGLFELNKLKNLQMRSNRLTEIPDIISKLHSLQYLDCSLNEIRIINKLPAALHTFKLRAGRNSRLTIVSNIGNTCRRMKHLDLSNNHIDSKDEAMDNEIGVLSTVSQMTKLTYLNVEARANCIVSLPEKMAPEMLEELYLDDNELNDISNVKFNSMAKLRILSLRNNHLQTIPDSLGRVFNLETLDLEGNQINDIPENLSWTRLKKINLSKNKLKQFPTQLEKAPQLENLNLSNNTLGDTTTRTLFSTLQKLKCLNIKNTDSKHIPDGCCHSENLEELILSDNNIEEIPHDIQQMKNLQELHIDNNNIEVVPKHVFQHTSLKSIHANDNKIHTVSHKISANNKGRRLTLLDMSNNILKSLPSSLQNVTTLKTFDVSYNQMYFIPSALVELTATTDSDNKQREILIKGNLARNIPSSVNKNVPLTNLKSVGDESDINQLKRACMYFIGSRSSGKSLLMRKLLLASGRKSGVPETNSLKNNAAFLNSNIWPVHDDIDIKVTDCSGPVELQAIAQLFFVTNAVYIITVNLKQYDPSGDSFRQKLSRAVDLVTERFDSQKWKLLAQFLGIQTEAIDRERISVKDKLRTMVQAWSEKHQAPALIPMMKDKLVQALRVVGDAQLANDIEHISIQNWTL
uniref:Leucine-rich repeat and death domain-containing protein 1-like n=1 Tax=Saccoglossus kowalevskii TaxID=10224 RepID=A0ABM0MAK6_SACKO|nr:PREDICTED: leucine-rich repeat and death domain-containing protein 1-like [Saccoglossus kowalevskii]